MDMKNVGLYILLCAKVFLLVKGQVTFNPDPEEDVELQKQPLSPFVEVTTKQTYLSSPKFTIQYTTTDGNTVVYNIFDAANGSSIPDSPCKQNQCQYRVQLRNLAFLADPRLVGGMFKLKATLDNNEENSTISKRTYIFSAPINLTGSSGSAVPHFNFAWTCHVTSDFPIVEWYRGNTILGQVGFVNGSCSSSGQHDSYIYTCQESPFTYTLTIPGSSLTEELQGSTWRCKEAAGATSELKGSKFMTLDIVYPPTVSLYIQNTTENTENNIIRCRAEGGKPNNAKILALQQRIGSTLIRNITSFTESSPGNKTLTIPRVSYQDMGTYTCLASNGIPDRSNQKIQTDTAYLNVITSVKFEMEQYIVRSDINTQAVVRIPFYKNPLATESDVVWTKNTGSSNETLVSSANVALSLSDADIQQTLHGIDVTLKGQSAIMNIISFKSYYEGNYNLKIKSSHTDTAEVTIVLMRSGPPDTPSHFKLLTSKVTSVVLTWKKGSDGGHPQTFVILYKEKTSEVYTRKQLDDTSMDNNITDEVKNLKPDTNYVFLLYSFNEKGNSTGHQTVEESTLKAPAVNTPSSQNNSVVGGAVGAVVAALVIVIVIVVVLLRRSQGKGQQKDSKGKDISAVPSRQTDDDEGRTYENVEGAIQNATNLNGSKDKKKAKEKGHGGKQHHYQNQDGSFYMDLHFDRPTHDDEERAAYTMLQFGQQHTYSNIDNVHGAEEAQ